MARRYLVAQLQLIWLMNRAFNYNMIFWKTISGRKLIELAFELAGGLPMFDR